MIKISEITLPEHYVRGATKKSHINDLLSVVAGANGVEEPEKLIGKKDIKWPFPPIEIGRTGDTTYKDLEKLEEEIVNIKDAIKTEKKRDTPRQENLSKLGLELDLNKQNLKVLKGKKSFPFELIDGAHRLAVARILKLEEIDGTIKNIEPGAERFLRQYNLNAGHGLRLDKDMRDNAIRILSTVYKIPQKAIVAETGLDVSSVSRIIANKQRTNAPRKKAEPRKQKPEFNEKDFKQPETEPEEKNVKPAGNGKVTKAASSNVNDGMSVTGFIDRLIILYDGFIPLRLQLINHWKSNPLSHEQKISATGFLKDLLKIIEEEK
jgi:hypothetical protein